MNFKIRLTEMFMQQEKIKNTLIEIAKELESMQIEMLEIQRQILIGEKEEME